jgi:hypothetical protein
MDDVCRRYTPAQSLTEIDRWLIANGRSEEAVQTLARFHTGGDSTHPLIQFEVEEIGRTIEMEKLAAKTSWKTLVQTPGNRKRTFIAICVGAFAQYNVTIPF